MRKSFIVAIALFFIALLVGCNTETTASTEEQNNEENRSGENVKNEQNSNGGKQNEGEEVSKEDNGSDFKVTLLGTGNPIPEIDRFGASTLVEVGGEKLLFDAGRGSIMRLSQLGIVPAEIDKLFITHLHHDHTVGFPDILISGSVPIPGMGGRENEFEVWGPVGTQNMVEGLYQAYATDIKNRQSVAKSSSSGLTTNVHEIEEGVVYDKNGIEVIAFEVDHGSLEPAYGYRINYKGNSVVISGDTTYSENLIKHANGTDLIIHEVIASHSNPEDELLSASIENITAYHSTPEQAAEVFKQINPELAVYNHIISLGLTENEENHIERTKEVYDGEVILGEDLMSFEIGDTVEVNQPNKE